MERQVTGLFLALLFVLGLTGTSAFAALPEPPDADDSYCPLLLEFFALDAEHHNLKLLGMPIPPALEARRKELRPLVFSGQANRRPIERARLKPIDEPDTSSFLPYADWTPGGSSDWSVEGGVSDWTPEADIPEWTPELEAEREARAARGNPTESNFYGLEKQLDALTSYLEAHDYENVEARVDAVYRRVVAQRNHKSNRYLRDLERLRVMTATQQVFTLELWSHEYTQRYTTEPVIADLARFAGVVNLDTAEAMRALSFLDLNTKRVSPGAQVKTFHEIMDSLSERLSMTPQQLFTALEDFRTSTDHPFPTETFGKLLFYFVGTRDDLILIHDVQSLEKFLLAHQD